MFGLFDRIRFRAAKLLYDGFFVVMVRDASWQEPLLAAIAPNANSRILNFGLGSVSTARNLAARFPQANIVGADPNPKAVERMRRLIMRRNISNITVIAAPCQGRLPFDANSFDKVVLVLALHDRTPDIKLAIANEMLRVLRHGGTLHVADYDKPATPRERGTLTFAEYISGRAAAEPHLNGNWTAFFAKAGFVGIRRQSSHSIGIGRITVVKARKS
jgi:ubiquinone/menaquinone biosynthesis C-methylase UbiE